MRKIYFHHVSINSQRTRLKCFITLTRCGWGGKKVVSHEILIYVSNILIRKKNERVISCLISVKDELGGNQLAFTSWDYDYLGDNMVIWRHWRTATIMFKKRQFNNFPSESFKAFLSLAFFFPLNLELNKKRVTENLIFIVGDPSNFSKLTEPLVYVN